MKIFGFFYSEKVIFHQNKKNFIIAQKRERLTTLTTRDDNGRVWDETAPSRLGSFIFFLIPKSISFKKLNGARRNGKIPKPVLFTFDFCFYFLFFNICFFIFIILKLIYFIKNKNIMNFYKLFIKKHSNNNYY